MLPRQCPCQIVQESCRSCVCPDFPPLLSFPLFFVVWLEVIQPSQWPELIVYRLLSGSPSPTFVHLTNNIAPAERLSCAVVEIDARVNDHGYTKYFLGDGLRNHLLARAIPPFELVYLRRSDCHHAELVSASEDALWQLGPSDLLTYRSLDL